MFARHVTLKLRARSVAELPLVIENKVLPLLRRQKGFRDEITLVSSERLLAVGISIWDTKEDADAYNRTEFPEVFKALSELVEGTPKVETFEVTNSTFSKAAARSAAETF